MAESLWTLPFGKYIDKDIEDVPTDYLNWLLEQDWFFKKYRHGAEQTTKELSYRMQHEVKVEDDEDEQQTEGGWWRV